MKKQLTSKKTEPNAIMHHSIGLYGKDCPRCKKPLRTPKARYCAACGFGKENLNSNTLPLSKRFPDSLEE